MKFCTTCGRTYDDPEIGMCPHDGTPLFGMAGSEGQDLPAEEGADAAPEEVASVEAPDLATAQLEPEEEPVAVAEEPSLEDELFAPASEPEDDGDDLFAPASEPEEDDGDDLFAPVSEPEEEPVDDVSLEDALAANEAALFGDSEEDSLLDGDSEAMPETAPVLGDALFDDAPRQSYDIEVPGADDAASIQISEAIDTTLVGLGEDSEQDGDTSLADAYEPESIVAEPAVPLTDLDDDPLNSGSGGGRGGLIAALLVIIVVAGLAWYFLMGPGAEKPTPDTPTPPAATQDATTTPAKDVAKPAEATPDMGADAGKEAKDVKDVNTDKDVKKPEPDGKGIAPPPIKEDPKKKPAVKKKPPTKKPVVKKPVVKKDPPAVKKKDPPAKKVEEKKDPPKEEKAPEKLSDELDNLLD